MLCFDRGPEERSYETSIRDFCRKEIQPHLVSAQIPAELRPDIWKRCGQLGLLGLSVPEEFGGSGFGPRKTACLTEVFGRSCPDTGFLFSCAAHLFAGTMPLVEFGSDELKKRYVPDLVSGSKVIANAVSEPHAGSDLSLMEATALKSGNGYLLSGDKSYVTSGDRADVFLVYAKTDPDHGFMGMSAFLVDSSSEGITTGNSYDKIGLDSATTVPVSFSKVRIPEENLLGGTGQGLTIFSQSMNWERSCLFAGYLGRLDHQLAQVIRHAKNRRQFRKSLSRNQTISHKIVDMKQRLEAARLMMYRACWEFENQHKDFDMWISLAKLMVSEAAVQSGLDAIQIHGGLGCISEGGIPQYLQDAIPSRIFSGTNEIQKNIIARILGL